MKNQDNWDKSPDPWVLICITICIIGLLFCSGCTSVQKSSNPHWIYPTDLEEIQLV